MTLKCKCGGEIEEDDFGNWKCRKCGAIGNATWEDATPVSKASMEAKK